MKALVLSGGSGTRLRPITHTSAKQLVPIANRPVLFYGLDSLRDAGIEEVGIVVGATSAEVRAAVGDGSQFGLRVTYIEQQAPLGLAHCVLISREFLGEDEFVMYLGDNFLVGGVAPAVERFRAEPCDARVLLTKVADPSRFGVAELDADGRIDNLVEKPSHPRSDLAIVGAYVLGPRIHQAVRAISPSDRGELEITDALRWLLDHGGRLVPEVITGYWKDTGQAEDMLECNRIVLDTITDEVSGQIDDRSTLTGRVILAADASVSNSRLAGPLIIGAGARIEDSYIGPFTSIGDGCTITGTEIEDSIVMSDTTITGVRRIQESLIGRRVRVGPAHGVAHNHRLVLGDHSSIQLAV